MEPAVLEATASTTTTTTSATKVEPKDAGEKLQKVFKTDFDAKYNIVDIPTPRNAFMSGQYKRSYAYYTIRSRLPVILTNVIDRMTKDKNELVTQFGESAREELKIIIGFISRLKYELQTDKPFQQFTGDEPDRELWNNFLAHLSEDEGTFYRGCWLHAECYMYRKLYSFVENSIFLRQFDYFGKAKEQALVSSIDDIISLVKYTRRTEKNVEMFDELLKFSLWANRNDDPETASLFNRKVLEDAGSTNDYILVNHSKQLWDCLEKKPTQKKHLQQVDYILDNVGYELFTDFILAEFMIEKGLTQKVRFHVKAHPWFVSDVTEHDFKWTLEYLSQHSDYIVSLIGKKFSQFLDDGKFELAAASPFWTGPYAYHRMRDVSPDLYNSLQQSKLIIFKGDLNYRKLMNDVCWEPTQEVTTSLSGFLPTNLCALRSIKAEVIAGLPEGVYETLCKQDPQWMITGNYSVIQFVDGTREFGY
ncbi:damage-control phosphatase ARMT1 [Drosophila tropicalis]|uniref:damage-control phosphatase ARMT1 n=1 Tax=Drosophila tropicalis TaxID=46794 RepID=UPI0035ABA082